MGSTLLGTSAEPTDDHGDWGEGMEPSPVSPTGARGSWVDFVQIFKKPSSHVASHQEWCNKEAHSSLDRIKYLHPGVTPTFGGRLFPRKPPPKGSVGPE